jgi:hypothetical protein
VAAREDNLIPHTITPWRADVVSALLLYGVVGLEAADNDSLAPGTTAVAFRDLGAVVSEAQYSSRIADIAEVEAHRRVVEPIFTRRPFLPAPVGIVFRSREALIRWLELHYVTLTDGLSFVEGRVGARVHLSRRPGEGSDRLDVSHSAAEIFRTLRQNCAASVTLKPREGGGRHASAAFLVERQRWDGFLDVIMEEARQHPDLMFDHTGPWPPYDFVNMQFGV